MNIGRLTRAASTACYHKSLRAATSSRPTRARFSYLRLAGSSAAGQGWMTLRVNYDLRGCRRVTQDRSRTPGKCRAHAASELYRGGEVGVPCWARCPERDGRALFASRLT
jgi:hypothetical protein